ncbi:MAG: iron-sulfur cluster assembly scaffold protein [Pseudomonadota bacterium]
MMESHTEKELFEQLQAEIIEDARKVYSEKVIDRWFNPRNWGRIENPQGIGRLTGICGDTMETTLRINDSRILEAKFSTEGCGPTLAAGSMATELAVGKSVQEGFKISQEVILDNLGGLPQESEHCALLASDTLKEALKDHLAFKQEPWKKVYQKH